MTTYFISDLHLNEGSTENSKRLLEFLSVVGPGADAIYILGDFFGLWVGDDLNLSFANQLSIALKTLADQGVPLFIMRGNRDFLLGNKFCQSSGCKLLPDPCVVNLYGKTVLLTHGDLLCSLDLKYQYFRKIVQNPIIKKLFLSLPATIRTKLAGWIKTKSSSNYRQISNKDIWDVSATTVEEWFIKYKVDYLIHGHTHKPAIHQINNKTRIVLGDWTQNSAKILAFSAENFKLQDLATESY